MSRVLKKTRSLFNYRRLGNIGLTLARYLAFNFNAKLILFSRRDLPPREQWDLIINQQGYNALTFNLVR